ncbi:MAG TPA: hypothetical protein DCX45_03655 [Acinetobacter junii]|nr:hypothetical protein [Acinetobacter junii]
MRNPLLTDGQKLQPLSVWKKELCGYTFEKNDINYCVLNCNLELKLELININTLPRKDYEREYKRLKRFKKIYGLKVNELAKIKFTTERTVYNNLQKFDIIPGISPLSIKFNQKIFLWNPLRNNIPSLEGNGRGGL